VLKLCLDYGITNQYSIPGREKGKVLWATCIKLFFEFFPSKKQVNV
jgi:hypothetical protein